MVGVGMGKVRSVWAGVSIIGIVGFRMVRRLMRGCRVIFWEGWRVVRRRGHEVVRGEVSGGFCDGWLRRWDWRSGWFVIEIALLITGHPLDKW